MQRFNGRAEASGIVITSGLNATNTADLTYGSATVTVSVVGGGLATIFSDNLSTPLANPFTANVDATFAFYAANGRYNVVVSGTGVPTINISDVLLFDSSLLNAGASNAMAFSATPTFNAALFSTFTMTMTGNVISSTLPGGTTGQIVFLMLTQGAGGPWTFVWPANVANPPVFTPTAAKTETFILELMPDGNWHVVGMGEYPLNQISAFTGTGGTVVMQTSPTITSPTITGTIAGGAAATFGNIITGSINAGANPLTVGAVTAASVNTVVYVAPGSSIQTAINALPTGGGKVLLSPGIYSITAAITPKSGTSIECTNTGWANTYDTAGCVIQPASGNAIWAIQGPTSGSSVTNVKLQDITIDLTADSSALGGINWQRALYSEFYNVRVLLPALGAMDGIRWDGTVNSYWNKCFACTVDSIAPGAISNTHNGFHYTAAANSNWCYGCVTLLVNNAFLIDGATSNVGLFGGGSDHFAANCISVQGTARGNLAKGVRCEESFQVPTGAAVNLGATVVENTFEQVYVVGAPNAAAVVTDLSGGKNTINVDDTTGAYVNIIYGNASQNYQIGVNKTPAVPGTFGLDVHGQIQADNYIYNTKAGDFRLYANNSTPNLSPILTLTGAAGADVLQLNANGTGGVFLATSGGVSFVGIQPNSFGNALVPGLDNTYSLGANTRRFSDLRFAGNIKPGTDALLISSTAPTIAGAGCGGSAATISVQNGTASFNINVGTAPTAPGCTVTMPAATTGWNCNVNDMTTLSTSVFVQKQTGAISTTSVTFQNFSDVAVATAPTANDIYHVTCMAY